MTGDIVRAITLTTYGRAFLKENYDISGLTIEHPSFIFTNKIEFQISKKHLLGKPTWHLYSESPINWLKKLKEEGCKELRMVFESDNSSNIKGEKIPDHQLAGFVGGGGHRYIETIFDNHSDIWQSKEEVTNKNARDNRIWSISYGRIITGRPTQEKVIYKIDAIKNRLKDKLKEIRSFAASENQTFWADWFGEALDLLESNSPYKKEQERQLIPSTKIDLNIIQLLAGSGKAWCFGGMGSWNDIVFTDKEKNEQYDKLTAELYEIVNESYIAAANSYGSDL